MKQSNTIEIMLRMMDQPAFWAEGSKITCVNAAAALCNLSVGTPLAALLGDNEADFLSLAEGSCLYLPVVTEQDVYTASVMRIGDGAVFTLDTEDSDRSLQALALAAKDLREPVGTAIIAATRMFRTKDSESVSSGDTALFNRSIHQLLRRISNMSDAANFQASPHWEIAEISAFIGEILEKTATLCENSQINFQFENLYEPLTMSIDKEKLERAVYNCLSNAVKFTPAGGHIHAKLFRRGSKLYFSLRDTGSGIPDSMLGNVYSQYLRQPSLEDASRGIGLGMVLIRGAAIAHGGTVLLEKNPGGGTHITFSLAIRQKNGDFRTPILGADYASGRDHGLLELSDIVPASQFDSSEIT